MDDPAPENTSPKMLQKIQARKEIHKDLHILWRVIWATGGALVLLAGIAMLVLPGPAVLVIPIGLAILALEFAWAERLLERGVETGMNFSGWLRDTVRARRTLVAVSVVLAAMAVLATGAIFLL